MTKTSATALAGTGLIGVAKDNYGRKGATRSFVAAFIELEVDVETGEYKIIDYLGVADVLPVHPRQLAAQIHGGAVQGFGHARTQKWVYDLQYGVALGKRFHHMRPPSILDVPFEREMQWAAIGIPDPQTPVGAKGVGEVVLGAGLAAVKCGLAAAIGDDYMRRTPVTIDVIVASLDAGKRVDAGLLTHV
jgi:CO/xanthine dehydrogenase Mo-binding subunit